MYFTIGVKTKLTKERILNALLKSDDTTQSIVMQEFDHEHFIYEKFFKEIAIHNEFCDAYERAINLMADFMISHSCYYGSSEDWGNSKFYKNYIQDKQESSLFRGW